MAKGVRQGCPVSGFLFALAFDPIFWWLQDAIIPRNLLAWTFYSRLSARMLTTLLWLPHLLWASSPRWHRRFTPWTTLLGSI